MSTDERRLKRAIAEMANAMQSVLLLASRLRQAADSHTKAAVALEGAVADAARVLKKLQPKGGAR